MIIIIIIIVRMMGMVMNMISRVTRLQFTVTPTLTLPKVSSGADDGFLMIVIIIMFKIVIVIMIKIVIIIMIKIVIILIKIIIAPQNVCPKAWGEVSQRTIPLHQRMEEHIRHTHWYSYKR